MNKTLAGGEYRQIGAYFEQLKVVAQNDPNMTVKINPGFFYIPGMELVEYTGGNSPIIQKPTTGTKIVVIGLNKLGTIFALSGEETAKNPPMPKLTKAQLPLAAIYLTATNTKITQDMIIDIRQFIGSATPATSHTELVDEDALNSHPMSAITGLAKALEEKATIDDLEKFNDRLRNIDGTASAKFVLNNANVNCGGSAGIVVDRGDESNVGIRFNETAQSWQFTNDGITWNDFLSSINVDGSLKEATSSTKGIVKLSVEPENPYAPIAVGDNDPRLANINNKANIVDVYNKTEVDDMLAPLAKSDNVYNKQSIQEMLDSKMDNGVVYTMAEIDQKLLGKISVGGAYTKAETDVLLANKADVEDTYTKAEVDDAINAKIDSEDVYTKVEVDATIDTLQSDINTKANAEEVYTKEDADAKFAEITNMYDKTEIDSLLDDKANAEEVYTKEEIDNSLTTIQTNIDEKAVKADVYEKLEIDQMMLTRALANETYNKVEVNNIADTKADVTNVYSKVDADALLNDKANVVDVYSITDADAKFAEIANTYDKTEMDNLLIAKANVNDVYTVAQIDGFVNDLQSNKADKANVYTKDETDLKLADYALSDNVHSKTAIEVMLKDYAKKDDVISDLGDYALKDNVNTKAEIKQMLDKKADSENLASILNDKAEVTSVYTRSEMDSKLTAYATATELAKKVNEDQVYLRGAVDNELAKKADLTNVDIALASKADKTSLASYATKDEVYTKAETMTEMSNFVSNFTHDKAEIEALVNTKIGANDIVGKADIDYVNSELAKKANASDVYAKSEVNESLALKADANNVYSKTEIDTELAKKANANEVYTKDEVNTELDKYVKIEDLSTSLVLTSPNGTEYVLSVSDEGVLQAVVKG